MLPRAQNAVGTSIGRSSLQVGQWVKFSSNGHQNLTEEQKPIYQEGRYFLVLTREDAMFDGCRCMLVDENGKTYDYCPRMNSLNHVDLQWNSNIKAFTKEEIENIYGHEIVFIIYEAGKKYLEQAKDYFAKYRAQILNVQIEIQNITHKIIEKKYTEGAIVGAMQELLPAELSSIIAKNLNRQEGGRLAQTCKNASNKANENKNLKLQAVEKKRHNAELAQQAEAEEIKRAREESMRKYQEQLAQQKIEAEKRQREEQERIAAEERARIATEEAARQASMSKLCNALDTIKTFIVDKLISPELNNPLNDISKPWNLGYLGYSRFSITYNNTVYSVPKGISDIYAILSNNQLTPFEKLQNIKIVIDGIDAQSESKRIAFRIFGIGRSKETTLFYQKIRSTTATISAVDISLIDNNVRRRNNR